MIANTSTVLCWLEQSFRITQEFWNSRLLEQYARAANLLCAQRAQEARHDAVHQLEICRQSWDALLLRIENLFAIALGMQNGAAAAVDEHEPRLQDKALAFLICTHGDDAPAAERIVDLSIRHHETGVLLR